MQKIKILGGQFKNRCILFMPRPGMRPTRHRLRKTVFDILMHRYLDQSEDRESALNKVSVCDLFAGTGAYGFEALSRGAHHAVFIDQKIESVRLIQKTAQLFGIKDKIQTVLTLVPPVPAISKAPFDWIFIDPPYQMSAKTLQNLLAHLLDVSYVKAGGLVIVETLHNDLTCPGYERIFERECAGVFVLIFSPLPNHCTILKGSDATEDDDPAPSVLHHYTDDGGTLSPEKG